MRRHFAFDCSGAACAASLDLPDGAPGDTGLVIVSGGNEIRSGPHRSQAELAAAMTARGVPVMRYDRRGIGDSEGENSGWRGSAEDLTAAVRAFRAEVPGVKRIIGYGNCDGASALILFGRQAGFDRIIAANPWTYDHDGESEAEPDEAATTPDAAHARAHYLKRLARPGALIGDLLAGRIDFARLGKGLGAVLKGEQPSVTGARLAEALADWGDDAAVLLAGADRTAIRFDAQMKLAKARLSPARLADGSHSFAADAEREWLHARLADALAAAWAARRP